MPKFCVNCGSELVEGARFCNKCGATVTPTEQPQAAPSFTPPSPQFQAPQYQSGPQSPSFQAPPANVGLQPHVAGMLCYIFGLITGIIFLVLEPYNKDRFVRFHAFQSIFFSVASIVLSLVFGIISGILYTILPWPLYSVISLLFLVVRLGLFVMWLYLLYKAYNHEKFKLPLIGDLAEKQAG